MNCSVYYLPAVGIDRVEGSGGKRTEENVRVTGPATRLGQKVGALATKVGGATWSTQSKMNVNANAAFKADCTATNVAGRYMAVTERFSGDICNNCC